MAQEIEVREAGRWTAQELAELTFEISRHDSEPYIRFTYVHGDKKIPIPGITEVGAKAVQAVLANFAETYAKSVILRLAEEAEREAAKADKEWGIMSTDVQVPRIVAAWLREKAK